ncbi:hypothetical protein [Helicobacter sp. 23-1045]
MSKKDKKDRLLAEYQRWQNYCVTIFIAVVAFIATQYDTMATFLLYLSIVLVVFLGVAIALLAKKNQKNH